MLDVAKGAEVTMISYFKEQQEIMFKELKKSMSKNWQMENLNKKNGNDLKNENSGIEKINNSNLKFTEVA